MLYKIRPSLSYVPVRYYRIGSNIFGNYAQQPEESQKLLNAEQGKVNGGKQIENLVNAFRRFGYLGADLDPLQLWKSSEVKELDPALYGFDREALDELLNGGHATGEEFIEHLRNTYCGQCSAEFMHLTEMTERQWFARHYEQFLADGVRVQDKITALEVMLKAKAWENFLAVKFPTVKRYSGEGSEAAVGLYSYLLEDSPNYGIKEFIFEGAHRGKLALQTIIFRYSAAQLFRKIRGKPEFPDNIQGSGDVLTHQISHFDYLTRAGEQMHVSTLPNPSHLEVSLPVATGKARGRAQTLRLGDYGTGRVGDGILCVHHHGDGAFTGQGVVWETLAMSQIPHFRIGGSIHVVVNNQVAFTAERDIGRSSTHCTDIAKSIDSPIIHVNGNNVEKVLASARLALAYRQQFRKDVFINLVCFRKHGHNELDDPSFTQPLMYKTIKQQKCVVDSFVERMSDDGHFSKEQSAKVSVDFTTELERDLKAVDSGEVPPRVDHLEGYWKGFSQAPSAVTKWQTGLDTDLLRYIGAKSVQIPENFNVHPHIRKTHIDARLNRLRSADKIDWSTAEALAWGSLLLQNYNVRISGQDVGRATFSHRHSMLIDQTNDSIHIPLNHLSPDQKSFFEIANSPLSEFAVLAFEYGMSIENPRRLCIWEAQFGDFYNGAQIAIDCLVATGESKWLTQSGLVLLLPHGFDGTGPDHSSSHVERFLQLTDSRESQKPIDGDNVNMFVANPTSSAQYFHLLRRQMVTPYRKPLIVVSPKILLRHPAAMSSLEEFGPESYFRPVIANTPSNPNGVKKIIFCSGKHAIILEAEIQQRNLEGYAVVRLESLCPFPTSELAETINHFPNARDFIWSQEEPRNAGFWTFVAPRFRNGLGIQLTYNGRPEISWMATAIAEHHKKEADEILLDLFGK
ncbi:transketolase, pyrimidine binding domain-containing protein [Ditylenchus destructor]|nr:transketolase, pyrimidine binding domain-containing protein [Ditylenchus destructor]